MQEFLLSFPEYNWLIAVTNPSLIPRKPTRIAGTVLFVSLRNKM